MEASGLSNDRLQEEISTLEMKIADLEFKSQYNQIEQD